MNTFQVYIVQYTSNGEKYLFCMSRRVQKNVMTIKITGKQDQKLQL